MKIENLINREVQIEGEAFIYNGIVPYQFFDVRTLQHKFISVNGKLKHYKYSTEFDIEESKGKIILKIV